jgi:ubiquinone/menaquinone biosynthesis C-methylase UbiE
VTIALASRVPEGRVLGTDLDDTQLDLARREAEAAGLANVTYRVADVMTPPSGDDVGSYDVVYVRFLLTPARSSGRAREHHRAADSGRRAVVEDIDFRGHFCDPEVPSFWKMVDWYTRAVRARGCDPNIGPRLPGMLRRAGLTQVDLHVVQPVGCVVQTWGRRAG